MTPPGFIAPWEAHDAVSERAADFFERRRFGAWSDADRAEFEHWLAESTLHRVTYIRLQGAVAHTEELAALRPTKPAPMSQPIVPGGERRPVRWRLPLLAAASVALIAALGIPFFNSLSQSPDRSFSTDVGGRTLVKFADGTDIELNTDTAMRFRMTGEERTVWLEKGEAWFHVSHDAANPFTVVIGKHRVTDLGTEFFVRRGSEGIEVALLAGRAALNTEGTPTAILAPGDDATATPVSVSVTRKTRQELADALAWRQGMLVFRNTPLADVVREFNRYNKTKLVIADPSIVGEPITADLRTDDFQAFLNLAQSALNLRAEREGGEILISRESKKSKRAAR